MVLPAVMAVIPHSMAIIAIAVCNPNGPAIAPIIGGNAIAPIQLIASTNPVIPPATDLSVDTATAIAVGNALATRRPMMPKPAIATRELFANDEMIATGTAKDIEIVSRASGRIHWMRFPAIIRPATIPIQTIDTERLASSRE